MLRAIYPGTFDPITNGHLDIIERAAKIFDELIVAVATNPVKKPLFSLEERVLMIREACAHLPNVRVESFNGLLVEFARSLDARVIVKGLRAVSDFDYEFQMASMNRKLAPDIETVFIMTSLEYAYLSSSIIKEAAMLGGCVQGLVPHSVLPRLKEKLAERGCISHSGSRNSNTEPAQGT
ncbi:MAG: pantetheine-phosphate adenylyltransferase [Armatimonadota bacterium]|nr:pantetheine-phosphate adenylyltransferase [Armatimonadota bacterium]MCX7777303.1 pantetheine-phosphate adenylyltransferase [Armatimonadota bacterium]MDW8024380.1 pantetheine-phosphate adenylyltransferase [Armatimonadota bacterium]